MKKTIIAALCAAALSVLMLAGCSGSSFKMEDGVLSPDGTYTVAATLEGGSGKATIKSPVTVKAANGKMTATIVWSSSSYDKMTVAGVDYKPTSIKDGATFEVPVKALDEPLSVSAQTTAMSGPHTINYTIKFDPLKVKKA